MNGVRQSGEAVTVTMVDHAALRRAAAEFLFSRPSTPGSDTDLDATTIERLRDLYALELVDLREHSIRQVAAITRESKSTVARRVERARSRMLDELGHSPGV